MARPRPSPDSPDRVGVDDQDLDDGPGSAARRAPFSANPQVGVRGQRTQQRILDAALTVFGDRGYHRTGIAHITAVAGCSRASFYQYFSSKEDVYRHLTGQVARQLNASTEALGPVTGDLEGWRSLRAWVGRHGDIYERYIAVFQAFPAAAESDDAVGPGAIRTSERNVARFRAKLGTTTLPSRKLDPVVGLTMECLTRAHETARVLRSAAPSAYPASRVDDALADVIHRSLFGLLPDVNVHAAADEPPPTLRFGRVMRDALARDEASLELTAAGRRTLTALVRAGRQVFVARGYHQTRIDDVVAAAGVSHGAFYRYFDGKDHLAHALAVRAIRNVSGPFADIPETSDSPEGRLDRATLRRWLRHYNASQATEAAMIRVWVDAAFDDDALRDDSAAALDWGRRTLRRFLRPRDFGDVETEAVVMLALVSSFGTRERSAATIDAAAHIVEHGLLGQ